MGQNERGLTMVFSDLYWIEHYETITDERLCDMRANKCEEYCGRCYPLTITVHRRRIVYRYGTAKQRVIGLAQLKYLYGDNIKPVYECAYLKGGK